jgi:hypothetical protein
MADSGKRIVWSALKLNVTNAKKNKRLYFNAVLGDYFTRLLNFFRSLKIDFFVMLTRINWLTVKSEISTELGLRSKFSEFLGEQQNDLFPMM